MKLSEKAEEILEHLWIATEEKGQDKVHISELKTQPEAPELNELCSLNFIVMRGEEVSLGEKGREEARRVLRRHRLAERLMIDVFDIGQNLMEETACQFEHLLREEVEESICTLLGHPRFCPHGRPIPPGPCCSNSLKTLNSLVLDLTQVKKGKKGKVAYLCTRDNKKLRKLMTLGVLPGVAIDVIETFPSYVFRAGNTMVAVDKEMAKDIFLRLNPK